MEGRTLQINPAEDGLADIIISDPGVKDEKNARPERHFLQPIDDYSQRLSHSSDPISSTQQSASTSPPRVYQNESRRRLNTLHRPMNFAHEAQGQPPPPHENSPSDHNLLDFSFDDHEKLQSNDEHQFGGKKQDEIKQLEQGFDPSICAYDPTIDSDSFITLHHYPNGQLSENLYIPSLEPHGDVRPISPETVQKRDGSTSSGPAGQVKARKSSNKTQAVEVASQTSQTGQTAFPRYGNNFPDVSSAGSQTVSPDDPPPFPPETKPTQSQTELPRGHILEKQTEKSPGDPESIQDDLSSFESEPAKIVPPNARWTKIDRRLVNPQALEEAKERFEERLDCVIVLRVLTKVEIQSLANRTRDIREMREANGKLCSRSMRV
jgi:hypothetical protein